MFSPSLREQRRAKPQCVQWVLFSLSLSRSLLSRLSHLSLSSAPLRHARALQTRFTANFLWANKMIANVIFQPDYNYNGGSANLWIKVTDSGLLSTGLGGPQVPFLTENGSITVTGKMPLIMFSNPSFNSTEPQNKHIGLVCTKFCPRTNSLTTPVFSHTLFARLHPV